MKLSKMSVKKSAMLLGMAGMFAAAVACNSPKNNERQEADPGMEDNMYEEPMPYDDITSAVDTTLTDTLDTSGDRKSVVQGKSGSDRVERGGRWSIQNNKHKQHTCITHH